MGKIYLFRHGKPVLPEQKIFLGRTEVPLSAEGKRQMEQQGRRLAGENISTIYHSPLERCVVSAQLLAAQLPTAPPLIVDHDLQEIYLGLWENQPMEMIRQQYPEAYRQRGENLATFRPPQGESFEDCQRRVIAAWQRMIHAMTEKDSIAIVAHAGVNRCLLAWLRGIALQDIFSIAQPYGGMDIITWSEAVVDAYRD